MAFPNPFNRVWMDRAIEKRPTRPALVQQYKGLEFFPMTRVWSYDLTWDLIKSGNHLAGFYAHDGVPIPGTGYDFESMIADVMHIMANRIIHPNTVLKLRQIGEPSVHNTLVTGLRQRLLAKVLKSIGECQDESEALIEYLCMHTLQGEIVWPPVTDAGGAIANAPASWGNVSFTLDLGFRAGFMQDASTLTGWNARAGTQVAWSTVATANPIKDLEVIREDMQRTTGLPTWGAKLIMDSTTLSYMAENTAILAWIRGTDAGIQYIDQGLLQAAIKTKLGFNLEVYDSVWTYETGKGLDAGHTETQVHFLKPGRVLIIPNGALGDGVSYFAAAPDLGAPNGERLGLYTWEHGVPEPPWTQSVGCGIHGFPILKSSQELYVLEALS